MTYKVALDDLADLIAPARIIICEGSKTKADKGFDADCYNRIFAESHPDTLFISAGGSTEVERSEDLIAVLHAVAKGAGVSRLIDRDEMTNEARDERINEGIQVLGRRELENYLYDPKVLMTFLSTNNKEGLAPGVLSKLEELVDCSTPDYGDMKKVTRELFEFIRKSTQISNLGNSRTEFALQHLVPALRSTPSVRKELEGDAFP